MKWYEKYLSVYGKPYAGVPAEVMDGIRNRLRTLQSDEPLVSVVVIAYNEEKHLPACLCRFRKACANIRWRSSA